MKLTVCDRQSYDITRREYTDEGFLRVPGRVARIGIQDYLASELGIKDRAPTDIVRIFRPETEVFNDESLKSYIGADVTDDHPPTMVDSQSYKQFTVGAAISAVRDGDFVCAELIVKDSDAIRNIETGKVQLSAGYTAEYDMTPGTFDGQSYDGVQRSIRINHVAIVTRARAGDMARLFDHKEAKTMHQITLDSGTVVEVADKATAMLVNDSIARIMKQVADKQGEIDTQSVVIENFDNEVKSLQLLTTDTALADNIKKVVDARMDAGKIAGKDFTCDSVDVATIQREALKVTKPKIDWSTKDESYVAAGFEMAVGDVSGEKPDDEDEEEMNDAGGRIRDSNDSYKGFANDANPNVDPKKERVSAYDSHKDELSNAWKKKDK